MFKNQASIIIIGIFLITMTGCQNPKTSSDVSNSPTSDQSDSSQQLKFESFEAWCRAKESIPAATQRTIDVLLSDLGTQDCKAADLQLKNLDELDISLNKISDLKPLAGLTNLKRLRLAENQISDVKPLAGLTNLTTLSLARNQISDVKPLAGLTNLDDLSLEENQISDVKPLASLTNLKILFLGVNQISDVKPLAGLTNLTSLSLEGNQISDVKPLASLTKLLKMGLNLRSNPIVDRVCPLKSAACRF